jgi:hypothetical protein
LIGHYLGVQAFDDRIRLLIRDAATHDHSDPHRQAPVGFAEADVRVGLVRDRLHHNGRRLVARNRLYSTAVDARADVCRTRQRGADPGNDRFADGGHVSGAGDLSDCADNARDGRIRCPSILGMNVDVEISRSPHQLDVIIGSQLHHEVDSADHIAMHAAMA